MGITHPKNVLPANHTSKIRPIQRVRDWSDILGTLSLVERLRARHPMKSVPEPRHVSTPNLEGVKAGRSLGGGTQHINSSPKAR